MTVQLQELLETIKRDGIEKAEHSAKKIIDRAEAQAASIVTHARSQAEQLLKDAKVKIERQERSSRELLKQAGRDLVLLVQNGLVTLFQRFLTLQHGKVLTPTHFADIIVKAISQALSTSEGGLRIEIAASEEKKILHHIRAQLTQDVLDGKVEIVSSPALKRGFRLSVQNGLLAYDLSIDAIAEAVGQALHPSLQQLLRENETSQES